MYISIGSTHSLVPGFKYTDDGKDDTLEQLRRIRPNATAAEEILRTRSSRPNTETSQDSWILVTLYFDHEGRSVASSARPRKLARVKSGYSAMIVLGLDELFDVATNSEKSTEEIVSCAQRQLYELVERARKLMTQRSARS